MLSSCVCKFNNLYVLILKVIAATVLSDPTKYSEAFLEKPNEEYCNWILNPEKWGGGSGFFPLLI